jgi:hypothetical protein
MQCCTRDCEKPGSSRGLCPTCYQRARRAVKSGKYTWTELEVSGLCLPGRKTKPKPVSGQSPETAKNFAAVLPPVWRPEDMTPEHGDPELRAKRVARNNEEIRLADAEHIARQLAHTMPPKDPYVQMTHSTPPPVQCNNGMEPATELTPELIENNEVYFRPGPLDAMFRPTEHRVSQYEKIQFEQLLKEEYNRGFQAGLKAERPIKKIYVSKNDVQFKTKEALVRYEKLVDEAERIANENRDLREEVNEISEKLDMPVLKEAVTFKGVPPTFVDELSEIAHDSKFPTFHEQIDPARLEELKQRVRDACNGKEAPDSGIVPITHGMSVDGIFEQEAENQNHHTGPLIDAEQAAREDEEEWENGTDLLQSTNTFPGRGVGTMPPIVPKADPYEPDDDMPEPEEFEAPEVEEDYEDDTIVTLKSQAGMMIAKAFGILPYDPAVKKIIRQCSAKINAGQDEREVLEGAVLWAQNEAKKRPIRKPKVKYAPNDPRSRTRPTGEDNSFIPERDLPLHMRDIGDPNYVPPVPMD